ncbi:hypothetical protein OE88DRAFT_469078 [Heliocybe sulcata]|uniref:BUB1 N-terminal domain-containing protein n=1 Tax=Heliocybe sulcata TaxID=5364 RepID=A0A5C3N5U6_9AGAM|nr:hypothetical protein OE88DRAFT_469078 [Heliocybe sulcata]
MAPPALVDDAPNPAAIVDCDVLEAAKENIQPIAAGRRVTALSAILSIPHAQREARLASTKNRLRINVEVAMEDEDDDPLEAYCRFVYWTVENYPQGQSAESGLLELLEEATRVLKDDRDGRWRSDIRYLKLWVLYASYIERPTIIYRFCLANDIGTKYALLYEEFALALERSRRREEADKIYVLGINRDAQPLERLQKKHDEFQKRMMVAAPVPSPEDDPAPEPRAEASTSRKALGTKARPASTSRPAADAPHEDDIPPLATVAPRPRPNARLQVFVDPTGEASESSTINPFPDVGTRVTRVKENVPEVKPLAGTTLRHSGKGKRLAAPAGTAARIAVYRDPEPEQEVKEEDGAEEMPLPSVATEKKKGKVAVYVDPEPEEDSAEEMPPPPVPPAKKGKAASATSRSKRSTAVRPAVYRAPEPGEDRANDMPPAPSEEKVPRRSTRSVAARMTAHTDPEPEEDKADDGPQILKGKGKAPARSTRSSAAKMAVYRDPDPEEGDADDAPPAKKSKRAASKSTASKMAVYVDPEPDQDGPNDIPAQALPEKRKNKAAAVPTRSHRAKIPVYVDPEPEEDAGNMPPAKKSKKTSAKATAAKIPVYVDPEPEGDDVNCMLPPPVPTEKNKGKAVAGPSQSAQKTRSFTPFCDNDAGPAVPAPGMAKSRSFTPYSDVDAEAAESKGVGTFMPYRDETANPAEQSSSADEPVIKIKKAGTTDAVAATEAEALRRDPFKNYDKALLPDLEGDDL